MTHSAPASSTATGAASGGNRLRPALLSEPRHALAAVRRTTRARAPMDRRFPECKQLHEAYRKCFAQQPFRWGQATGSSEDKCEDAYEAFRECVETSLEKQKEKK